MSYMESTSHIWWGQDLHLDVEVSSSGERNPTLDQEHSNKQNFHFRLFSFQIINTIYQVTGQMKKHQLSSSLEYCVYSYFTFGST